MTRIKSEVAFLAKLVSLNLASAMEYRASFITQIVGMFLNTGIYFVFWLLFFDRFGDVEGYGIRDIYLLFAVATLAFGISAALAGNVGTFMAMLIAQGRLDYYLSLPRNVLSHVMFSRMAVHAIGDLLFSICAFVLYGRLDLVTLLLYLLTGLMAALVYSGFAVLAGSLAFFIGNAQYTSGQMTNAMLTFALYPKGMFSGTARFMLYTILPAGFMGAVPVEIIADHNWSRIPFMLLGVVVVWTLALGAFHFGLRRYESGSAINVNM